MLRQAVGRAAMCVVFLSLVAGCAPRTNVEPTRALDAAAERYVRLVLAMGAYDADYVDAYYGPPAWRAEMEALPMTLPQIRRDADSVAAVAAGAVPALRDSLVRRRARSLADQLHAVSARAALLEGDSLSFDAESRALYGAVAPDVADSVFERALARIDLLLPGKGPLTSRYASYRKRFVIPKERVERVFSAAIREARERTRKHIALPDSERFTVEYVTGKPWGAYNWYKGGLRSVIQVNMDLPMYIDQPLGLACHEGYPGHHVYNVLAETEFVKQRGWVEFTINPLFSPASLQGEGSAEFGVGLAFSPGERLEFEKRVLYPLAGLDPREAERYAALAKLKRDLRYAGIVAARRYLNHQTNADQTVAWLRSHALQTEQQARHSIAFADRYRSYVINYALGEDRVSETLRARGAAEGDAGWAEFARLLQEPTVVEESQAGAPRK